MRASTPAFRITTCSRNCSVGLSDRITCLGDPMNEPRPKDFRVSNLVVLHGIKRLDEIDGQRYFQPDFAAAESVGHMSRRANADHRTLMEVVQGMMCSFNSVHICDVFARFEVPGSVGGIDSVTLHPSLRITNIPGVEMVRTPIFPLAAPKLAHLVELACGRRMPILIDPRANLRLIFSSLDPDDSGFEAFPFTPVECARINGGLNASLAIMPYYLNNPMLPSGVVLLRGDLRCKNSGLDGLQAAFWSAKAAMEMAVQFAFQQNYRFDTTTGLKRIADFEVDKRRSYDEFVAGRLKNLALVLIDLDNFKKVNDQGYMTGNLVLAKVADVLRETLGREDYLYRYGGDEFVLIVRDAENLGAVIEIAEAIRKNIEKADFRAADGGRLPLTCSVGVSEALKGKNGSVHTPGSSKAADAAGMTFHTANETLLKAKGVAGKNHTAVFFGPDEIRFIRNDNDDPPNVDSIVRRTDSDSI